MGALQIHQELVNEETGSTLLQLCPFQAISWEDGKLEISAGCRMCKLCVKNGPKGVITWEEEEAERSVDKDKWKGIAVYAEYVQGKLHPVVLELLGKAGELAKVINHPVYAVLIGNDVKAAAEELLHYGADAVYCYDAPGFAEFRVKPYADALADFVDAVKPSSVLVGATNLGRSLAPKVAARCYTGLTADCTVLKMKENTDLVQIRPAFGGNIMAQIVTPATRPQFCTVRYKIFSKPERKEKVAGSIIPMELKEHFFNTETKVIKQMEKPAEIDISEAEVIVAAGRGVKSRKDIKMLEELAGLLGARLACTRPLIEAGWFDAKHQIGLSGRTVKPKLIITAGISGSVQFVAGMKGADCIIAINKDKNAAIFDVAHYGFVGDIYEIIPALLKQAGGGVK